MSATARPHTKLAAALIAAGVVAGAPAMVGGGPESLPVLSGVGVRSASFVTDALNAVGDVVAAAADAVIDRKSTRLNSSHIQKSRMPSSA